MVAIRHRCADDRGSTELAIATPLLLLLILVVVQVAVWAHGHHTANTIATHGLAAARAADASADQGQAHAEQAANQLSGAVLTDPQITVERTATTASVRVEAEVPSFILGLVWRVAPEVSGPVERIPDGDEAAP